MTATVSAVVPDAVERTFIRDLPNHLGERVVVNGWLASQRRGKVRRFLIVRDRTGTVQAVSRDDADAAALDALTLESAIRIIGKVREIVASGFGEIEIEIEQIDALGPAQAPLPLDSRATPDARL